MKKEMLINVLQPEECRIAILEDGVLEELYVERTSHESYVGNIYKGRIVNIEPSIQAAFVDFGVGRNGFLHVSDVEPTYYRHLEARGDRGERGDRGHRGERGDRGDRRGNGRNRDRDRDRDRGYAPRQSAEERPTGPPLEADRAAPFGPENEDLVPDVEATLTQGSVAQEVEETPLEETPPIDDFAAGLLGGPEREQPPAQAPSGEEPPLVALPETQLEEDTGRPRRRARGGSRRPARRSSAEGKEEEGKKAEEAPPADPPKPRLMDSTERRTSDKETDATHGISPTADGPGTDFDQDLFFPPATSRKPSTPSASQESGVRSPESGARGQESEPERAEPAAPLAGQAEERPAPGPRPAPPRRPRPSGGRPRSFEEELAEDLEAAEVGDEGNVEVAAQTEREMEIEAELAPSEEEPVEEFEPEEFEEEFERPQHGRREGGRGRDRGERRDRGDRGDRGDRRGRRNGRRSSGGGRPGAGRPKPLIQDIFKRGQEVIVQVIKEGIGTKGPTLSTYISIAGRYLVLMPCLNRTGVSRKIADDDQRRRLREMFNELKPPPGLGFIMRTAAIDKNKKELQRDLVYLSRLWQVVARRIRKQKAPAEIYQESDMITRTIRDTFTSDIDTIWVDEPNAYNAAKEFLEVVMPRYADRIRLYEGPEPLFHKCGIEDEIARIQMRKVPLPMGGSIVIEQTEALVAIDVNSGNFRADRNDAEETAYQMNLQAAKEIARQLRLRDLGGVIVNDFIDMREERHRRGVEKAMRDAVKRDRARTKILKISQFGLIEMTRQRIRPSLKRSVYQDCPYCHGMAQVKTVESMSIEVMRMIQLAAHREQIYRVEVAVAEEVANYLHNKKRREIARLEEGGDISVQIRGLHGAPPEQMDFVCLDHNNNEIKLLPPEPVSGGRGRR
jgi:ribonuclease E